MEKKTLDIIIPCYNEEKMIPAFYQTLTAVMADLPVSCRIIFVNDGSTDDTLRLIQDLAASDTSVYYLSFSRNFGKEAAIYAGLLYANADYTAIMDADLQDPPRLLSEMLSYVLNGYECCCTRRVSRTGEPPIRSFFARRFYTLFNSLSDIKLVDGARDFRLMTRKYVEAVKTISERNRFSKGIFSWVGYRCKWLEYENVERASGESKWSFFSLLRYSLDGIINFSTVPLLFSSYLGLFMFLLAIVAIAVIVIRKLLFGDPVAGWPSLAAIILCVGGLLLFSMGIIGQYMARMYIEVKQRPIFVLEDSNIGAKRGAGEGS